MHIILSYSSEIKKEERSEEKKGILQHINDQLSLNYHV